jgi:hypothetical protein
MSLLTEQAAYKPEKAFNLLSNFPSKVFKNAVQELNEKQTISKKSGIAERIIPQRGGRLSEKFIFLIKGDAPDRLFFQARDFKKNLAAKNHVEISETISCGGMSLVFDLMASRQGKIICSMSGGMLVFSNLLELSDTVSLLLNQPNPEVQRSVVEPPVAEDISSIEQDEMDIVDFYDQAYQQIEADITASDARFYKRVYSLINASGKMGISGSELSKQLPIVSVSILRDILDKICKIAHPARGICIVSRVGHQSVAFVSHRYVAEWTISTTIDEDGANMEFVKRVDAKDFTPPYLWFDINGNKAVSGVGGLMGLGPAAENLYGNRHVMDRSTTWNLRGLISRSYYIVFTLLSS